MNNRKRLISKIMRRWGGFTSMRVYVYFDPITRIEMFQHLGVPTFNREDIPKIVASKPKFNPPKIR